MKKLLLGGACAASTFARTYPAQAADMPVPEPMAGMGWYVSVFGGASFARDGISPRMVLLVALTIRWT